MPPPYTLSARGQLLAGVQAALNTPSVTRLLATTDGIRPQWPRQDLVQVVASGNLSIFPFIVIVLGDEKPSPVTGTATAYGTSRNAIGPLDANGIGTQLIETAYWQAPLTLVIVAAGERGPDIADAIRTQVKTVLRGTQAPTGPTPTLIIPLPDSLDNLTVPGPFFGLSARLTDQGVREDYSLAKRDLYRFNLRYLAQYSEYRQETITMAQGVALRTYAAGPQQRITLTPQP